MPHLEDEVEFSFFRSSGPGGQKKNTTDSAVRARHIPTGITVVATSSRSQYLNKQAALEEIARRLEAARRPRRKRRPTRPTRASQERRLDEKRRHSETKRLRGRTED